MPFHLYKIVRVGDKPRWYGIHVRYDEDHWVSTCRETDAEGGDVEGGTVLASKFCGVNAEEVHRRMVDVLESMYDEVSPMVHGGVG